MKKLLVTFTLLLTVFIPTETISESSLLCHATCANPVAPVRISGLVATMYNAVETQCDSDPLITAGNYKINPKKASQHKWIALSRNLLKRWGGKFHYGDKVEITGAGHKNGIYKIVDTMNRRFKNRIDFLETGGTKHYKYKNVTIEKVNL